MLRPRSACADNPPCERSTKLARKGVKDGRFDVLNHVVLAAAIAETIKRMDL